MLNLQTLKITDKRSEVTKIFIIKKMCFEVQNLKAEVSTE